MSMAKVKRIEDPESFLRRSVLINNTIKRLQREVREEKMMRHGGYSSKLSCSSFRKSYACSRLSDMHIPDDDSPLSSSSLSRHNNYSNNSLSNNNGRKRSLSDDGEDDCDVQAVLSQIYIPPTPCIISSIDEDDCCDSSGSSPSKKAKMSLTSDDDAASLLVTDECSLEVDVDVDVVGDSETSDWPTPPEPQSEMIIVTPSVIDSSAANDSAIEAAIDSMESASSCLSQRSSVAIVGDVDGNVDVDDCEFSLDLPPSPPMSACSAIGMTRADEEVVVVTAEAGNVERQVSSSHESQVVMDDMTSSDGKENNTCTLKLSSCFSTPALLIPSTVAAAADCDTTPTNHATITAGIPAGDNSFIDTTDLSSTSSSTSSSPTSLSSALPTTSSMMDKQQQQQQQQQYSSCGHSSIFGELQSVVFHSLIASLET